MQSSLKLCLPVWFREDLRVLQETLLGHRRYLQSSYSQEGEDLLLLRLFGENFSGIFVDVGAHHPYRFSNTFLLYRRGWRGINIDPRPGVAEVFARARKRDISLELGVSEQGGHLEFHVFEEPALSTFDADLAQARVSDGWRMLGKRWIECVPLAEILAKHLHRLRASQIDLLTVDVEGLDLAVLRSNDWSKYRPRAIIVEILQSDLLAAQSSDVAKFLFDQGYVLQSKLVNSALFLRKSEG